MGKPLAAFIVLLGCLCMGATFQINPGDTVNCVATASPSPTATPSPTSTPTPSPSPTATPVCPIPVPALNNPQNPVSYGADATGANDSTTAFKNALAVGDLWVNTPGVYKLGSQINVPANRNIRCGNGSLATASSYALYEPNSPGLIFMVTSGSFTVAGCQFRGLNYNSGYNSSPGLYNVSGRFIYFNGGGVTSGLIANSDFNGYAAYNGAIFFDGHGSRPSNVTVTCNQAENSASKRFVEIDASDHVTISYNTLVDAPIEPEIQSSDQAITNTLITHNSLTWRYGSVDGGSAFYKTHGCGAANHISGGTTNYSGCTYSYNTSQDYPGASPGSSYQYEGNPAGGCSNSIVPGVYISNTCTGGCSIHCPPGSAGSNQ